MSFTLYPALDIRNGQVVRLRQGDYARETRYAVDALAQARTYAAQGARWLHLVDLDAARAGGYTLHALLRTLAGDSGLRVQTGGGVRTRQDVERLLDAGAARVVVGSLAVREPAMVADWLSEFGAERLTVALDTRCDSEGRWRLPTAGWTDTGGEELDTMLSHYVAAGLRHLLCTDIERDGEMAGPNIALYARLANTWPTLAVQASGGVRSPEDVEAARSAGCAGVVLGRALLEGAFRLDALAEAAC